MAPDSAHSIGDLAASLDVRAWIALGVFVVVAIAAAGAWLSRTLEAANRRRRATIRSRRAVDGENRSEALLARAGYVVLVRQPRLVFALLLDGAPRTVDLRADWLVERDGRRFVADTKTGARAPSLDHAPTRRQLLEYRVAYDVDGVLLIDAETNTVHEVRFPALERPPATRPFTSLLPWVLLLVGAVIVAARSL